MTSHPDRRRFLRNAATLLLVAPATREGVHGAMLHSRQGDRRRFTMDLTPGAIGVSVPLPEVVALAAEYGFESVAPDAGFLGQLSDEELAEFLEGLKGRGLVWGAAGLPVDFRGDEETYRAGMADLATLARTLQRAGVTRVGTWLRPAHPTLTYLSNFRQHTQRLREIATVLGDHGLRFGLEYVGPKTSWTAGRHAFVHTMAEARELIAAIDRDNVGLVLDSWHWYTAGESESDLLALSNRDVVACDLNDAPAGIPVDQQMDLRRELPMATGVIDLKTFLNALVQIGYDGPVRAEPFRQELRGLPADQAVAATAVAMKTAFALVACSRPGANRIVARSRRMARPRKRNVASRSQTRMAPGSAPTNAIRIRGARVHNLRDIDADLPRDRLVVFTGVSGSGKSSLAFDTLYAEGQRRYIESLSVDARQFLDQLERPDVDLIEGLPPTVAIDQHPRAASPRSTVGTISEVHDFLRLLYARAGIPHCPHCGQAIRRQPPERIVADVLALPEGQKVIVLAPLVRGRKGQHRETFEAIRRAGLIRARVDGAYIEIQDAPPLARNKAHTIEAVVDRLVVREGIRPRLAESVDRALKLGEGSVLLSIQEPGDAWTDRLLSAHLACPDCGIGLEALEPRLFSFNSPHGACPTCEGLGRIAPFQPDRLAPDRRRSLADGGIVALQHLRPREARSFLEGAFLTALLERYRLTRDTPFQDWPPRALAELFGGDDPAADALIPYLDRLSRETSATRRGALEGYREPLPCPSCGGARLRPEARAVMIQERAIHEIAAMSVARARATLETLHFDPPMDQVGPPIIAEARSRLDSLDQLGLGYLTLDRPSDTLSGGELQRVRLAAQIGNGLVGVAFIFDEPTAGLHPRDTDRLLRSLRSLRDSGNSVIVVEHDEAVIRAADWVLDLGPGAGPDGGRIVAQGPPDDLRGDESLTARYLNQGPRSKPRGKTRAGDIGPSWITIRAARMHNLKGDEVRIPVGALTCVTGVSGSGKSTLVIDFLAREVRRQLCGFGPRTTVTDAVEGLEAIDRLVVVDQAPIGRSPRSTPATYTGVFDEIRKVFARSREAKVRGYRASRFSFNVPGGRCETCRGQGMIRVGMQFLPDLYIPCEDCDGKRFNRQTLEVRYKGVSIGDVLAMRVDEALRFFEPIPRVHQGLVALQEAGLGYVNLGQSSTTLSGGESQRVKLAAELGRPPAGRTLYILDEPTAGLHFADVANLLGILDRLAERGNTLVIIEHNLDVIRAADWVVDLGPEGGDSGGHVLAMGLPAAIAATPGSHTGAALRGDLQRTSSGS